MELCCTQKLLKRLGEDPGAPIEATGRMHYWTCKEFVYERKRFAIALNRETMLTLVVRGAPKSKLRERLASSLAIGLQIFGVSEEDAQVEAEQMRTASFSKNRDRSLSGSLNDLAGHAPFYMCDLPDFSEEALMTLSYKLSKTPHVNRTPSFAIQSITDVFGL